MKNTQLRIIGTDNFNIQQAYKDIRTNLSFISADSKVFSVTSTKEDEGKTTVAINLAKSLSDLRKKTLIIDADLRDSDMISYTGLDSAEGLSEVLEGKCDWRNCVIKTQYECLDIILSGSDTTLPLELLSTEAFKSFIGEVREAYDYIVVDTPAAAHVLDPAIVGSVCDGVIYVVDNDNTKYNQLKATLDVLKQKNNNIIGVVRNNATHIPQKK